MSVRVNECICLCVYVVRRMTVATFIDEYFRHALPCQFVIDSFSVLYTCNKCQGSHFSEDSLKTYECAHICIRCHVFECK